MNMKKKTIEAGLLKGMEEALAHSKGSLKLKEIEKEIPGPAFIVSKLPGTISEG